MTAAGVPAFFPSLCCSRRPQELSAPTASLASSFVSFRCRPEAQSSHFAQGSRVQLLHEHLGSQPSVPGLSPVLAGVCAKGPGLHHLSPGPLGLSWVPGAPHGLPLGCSLMALGRRAHSPAWSFWAQGARRHSQGSTASVTSTSLPPPSGPPQATHPHLLSALAGERRPRWKVPAGRHRGLCGGWWWSSPSAVRAPRWAGSLWGSFPRCSSGPQRWG